MSAETSVVPLISTSVSGPSGIMHLPRLWAKILLHAHGRLAEGYRHGEGGFDERLCTHFELDRDAFVSFVETQQPDYMEAERYVLEHAKNVTPESIAAFNAHAIAANFSDPARGKQFRDRVGVDDATLENVVALNNLDDWKSFHELLTAR
jgi:hypothetical protein